METEAHQNGNRSLKDYIITSCYISLYISSISSHYIYLEYITIYVWWYVIYYFLLLQEPSEQEWSLILDSA